MLTLGIESSCDETAAAVLEGESTLLSNIIWDQTRIHSHYGGVVPELAGRSHVERIHLVIQQALEQAGVRLSDIDLIATTQGPGLIGSLLVGLNTAKAIAYSHDLPLVGINHLEGHLLAIFLQEPVEFPFICLIVSGGHTDLIRADGFSRYRLLGRTRDDAAGECYDKVAKMLGLGYPGGPIIDKMARSGNKTAVRFPRSYLEKGSLDFSFSGLKTSVKNYIARHPDQEKADVSASFQEAVVEVLTQKALLACRMENVPRLVVSGGVAANSRLRESIFSESATNKIQAWFPKPLFCTDNAAMIACAGYYRYKHVPDAVNGSRNMDAKANLNF